MKHGPNIASLAALLGDPARANMLTALMHGRALTAGELAREAGITAQTASGHISKLAEAGLLSRAKQGRHHYLRLSGPDVAQVLEGLMGLAARTGHLRTRPGPKDPALRKARVCYDHLAGDMGVRVFDSLVERAFLAGMPDAVVPTLSGRQFLCDFGLDVDAMAGGRRCLCRPCLDWSERRSHLGGALGAAVLTRIYELGWARRESDSRVVTFTPDGERAFRQAFA